MRTSDIYWGAIPFVFVQLLMVGLLIALPQMVTIGMEKPAVVDIDSVEIILPENQLRRARRGHGKHRRDR